MLISATLVATSFTVGKAITPFLDPVVLTLVRFTLAALLFTPYVSRRFGLPLPDRTALFRYSLISGALVGFFWLMFLSLRITNPLNTGVIFTTVPGISGIYSWFLLRERLGLYRILALLLAMIGALWVIFEGDIQHLLALDLNRGDLLFFGGCLLMALYMPLVKLLHRGEPMAVMTLWILITGCFWLLLFAVAKLPDNSLGISAADRLDGHRLSGPLHHHHHLFYLPVGHPSPWPDPGDGLLLPVSAIDRSD